MLGERKEIEFQNVTLETAHLREYYKKEIWKNPQDAINEGGETKENIYKDLIYLGITYPIKPINLG